MATKNRVEEFYRKKNSSSSTSSSTDRVRDFYSVKGNDYNTTQNTKRAKYQAQHYYDGYEAKKAETDELEKQNQLATDIAINMAKYGADKVLNGFGNPYTNHAVDTSDLKYTEEEYRNATKNLKNSDKAAEYLQEYPTISNQYTNQELLNGYTSREKNNLGVMDDDIYDYIKNAYDVNKNGATYNSIGYEDIAKKFNISEDQAEEYYNNFGNYVKYSDAYLQNKAHSQYEKTAQNAQNTEATTESQNSEYDNSLLGSEYHTDEAQKNYAYSKQAMEMYDNLSDELIDQIVDAYGNGNTETKSYLLKHSGYSDKELQQLYKIAENYNVYADTVKTYEYYDNGLKDIDQEDLEKLFYNVSEDRKNSTSNNGSYKTKFGLFSNPYTDETYDSNKEELISKYGEDKYNEMAKYADYFVGLSEKQDQYDSIKSILESDNHLLSGAAAVGLNIADVIGSVTTPIGMIDTGIQKLTGNDVPNPYSVGHTYDVFSNNLQQAESEVIDSPFWNFAYNTVSSIAKSALMMGTGTEAASALGMGEKVAKAIGFSQFGAGAFNQAYQESIEDGLGADTALKVATANGIFEGLFEELSFDKILSLKKVDTTSRKQLIKQLIETSFTEGSEEFFTTTADWMADYIEAGDMSEQERLRRDYINAGYSEEEADEKVMQQFWKEAALAFAGGAVSGFAHSGGTLALNSARINSLSKSIKNSGTDSLEELRQAALELDPSSEAYRIASEKSADELTTSDISSIIRGGVESGSIAESTKEVLVGALAESENMSEAEATAAVDNWINGEESSDGSYQLTDSTAESLISENKSKIKGTNVLSAAYKAKSKADINKSIEKAKKVDQKSIDSYVKKNGTIKGYTINEDGETTEPVEIAKFEMVGRNNDIPIAVLSNGTRKALDEVTIEDENVAKVIQDVLTTENAYAVNAAREYYDGTIATSNFSNAGIAFYNYGYNIASRNDTSFEDVNTPELNAYKSQVNNAYLKQMFSIGLNAAEKEMTAEQEKENNKPSKKISKSQNENAGKVTDKRHSGEGIDDEWSKFAGNVAEATGLNIVLTDDVIGGKNTNGNFTAAFGRIMVNTTADYAYATFIHELSEFGMAYNQKAMQQLIGTVLAYVNSTKGSAHLNKALSDYSATYRNVESVKSKRNASEEYIYDVMAGVFMTEAGMADFYDFVYENVDESRRNTVLKTLTDLFDFLVNKITSYFKNSDGYRKDGYGMAREKAKELRGQWRNVIQGAVENYNQNATSEGSTESANSVEVNSKYSEEQNSFRFENDGSVYIVNANDISTELWNEIAKRFKKIGYTDITNGKAAKEIFSKLASRSPKGYKCNTDQADEIRKIFNVSDENAEPKDVYAVAKKAEKHFGTTTRFKNAAYIDVNGKLIDFSDGQGYRVKDHREISEVLDLPDDAGYSDGLIEFMAEGNIRLQEYGIDISVLPNNNQRKVLRSFFNTLDGEVTVDFSSINGYNIGSAEYVEGTSSTRILNDISEFFETGNVPAGTYDGNTYYSVEVTPEEASKIKIKNVEVDPSKINGIGTVFDQDEYMDQLLSKTETIDDNGTIKHVIQMNGIKGKTEIGASRIEHAFYMCDKKNIKDISYSDMENIIVLSNLPEILKSSVKMFIIPNNNKHNNEAYVYYGMASVPYGKYYGTYIVRSVIEKREEGYILAKYNVFSGLIAAKAKKASATPIPSNKSQAAVLSVMPSLEYNLADVMKYVKNSPSNNDALRNIIVKEWDEFVSQNNLDENTLEALNNDDTSNSVEVSKLSDKDLNKNYMAAVTSNNLEEAQKYVGEAAKRAGYNLHAYHGTTSDYFTVFNTNEVNNNMGSHFGSKEIAENFASGEYGSGINVKNGRIYDVYIKASNPYETYDWFAQDDAYPSLEAVHMAEKINTKAAWDIIDKIKSNTTDEIREMMDDEDLLNEAYLDNDDQENTLYQGLRDLLKLGGWDSMKYINMLEVVGDIDYIIQNSNQIKSAEAVTYDNNGNVIPLSERFNPESDDIRYSVEVTTDSSGRNLSEDQKEYFKNSKVLDDYGRLLVMYHGTPMKGFTVFKPGSYFSQHKNIADIYQSSSASSISSPKTLRMKQESNTPGTYEVYLNIVNPFDTRNEKERKIFEKFYKEYGATKLQESGLPDWTDGSDLIEYLQDNGYDYDGLILDEGGLGGYGEEVIDRGLSYVPFYAENQVKDVNNIHPTEDPDFRYSVEVDQNEKIINNFTGKEISDETYSVLALLDKGIPVELNTIYGLPEMVEAKDDLKRIVENFSKENPGMNIDPEKDVEKSFTYLIDTEERKERRRNIVNMLVNSGSVTFDGDGKEVYNGDVRKDHRLDIVVGLPASGKSSSIVNPLSQYYKSQVIDSDIIKEQLPEFENGLGAGLVHEESSILNREVIEKVLELGNNFVLPIVGDDADKIYKKYILPAKLYGYDVKIHLNNLDNAKATSRLLKRFFKKKRFLDPALVVKKGNKPTKAFNEIKKRGVVDGYTEWDNDVAPGENPIPGVFSESEQEFVRKRTESGSAGIGVGRKARSEADEGVKRSVEVDPIEDLKNSFDVPDWEADFWEKINSGEWEDNEWSDGSSTENSNKYLSEAVNILEEGAKLVGNVELDEKAIKKMARDIKKYYSSTIDADKIAESLTKVFAYMASTEDISYGTMLGIMKEIATPIIESSEDISAAAKEEYDSVRSYLKNMKISLNDNQKKEVAYGYGSYNAFRKSLFGTVTLTNKGIPLDDIWTELCSHAPGLDVGTVDAEQPAALADYLEALKPARTNPFNQNKEQAAYDCAMDIYRRYFEYQAENTALEKAEAKLEPIKTGIVNAMKSYKKSTTENYKKAVAEEFRKAQSEKNAKLHQLAETLNTIESDQDSAIKVSDDLTAELLEAEKVKYQERIKKLRDQNENNVAKVKAQYKQSRENERYRRNNTALKNSVRSAVNSLNSMLTSPNVNNHIKKNLVRPVIDVLEAINLDTGKSKTMQDKLIKLAHVYDTYRSDKQFEVDYDENLAKKITDLSALFADRNYTELTNDELSQVLEIVKALKKQIQNSNRLIQNQKIKDAYEGARTIVDELEASPGVHTAIGEALNTYNTWQLNAYREFRKLSGYEDDSVIMSLYNELQTGELKQLEFQRAANKIFSDVMDGSENQKQMKSMLSTKPEDLVDIGLKDKNGNKVLVTRDMRMSLILHSMNQSNMNHVLGGGLTIPDLGLYSKGKYQQALTKGNTFRFVSYETAIKYAQANAKWAKNRSNESLQQEFESAKAQMEVERQQSAAKIDQLVNELSDWEKKYLEKAKEFFHTMTGEYINEVTEELRGYAVASVKNYFPIVTDPDFTKSEFAGLIQDASLEGWGNLKSRVNASNPILLEGLSNVLLRQINKTSTYIGYAIPVRDFDMLFNKTFYDNKTGELKSVKNSVKKNWSNYDEDYLTNLMKDIQGGRKDTANFIDIFLDKLRGNFAGATLTANVGVAMKQAASYPTAAAVVGWKPLGKALKDVGKGFIKHGIKELEDINPLLWNRTQGMSSQEIAYAKRSELYKKAPKWMKNISVDLIQNVDTATVTTLEYASKYYVDDNFKDLQEGSEEYWQKVSEVFTKVVTETQPNYTVLQRPEVLRNPNQLMKQLVMFKTQPLQNFGILYDAWHECNAMRLKLKANDTSENQAKYKAAKKHLIRAVTSQLAAAVTFSAMTIISNMAYHKLWKYDQDDDKTMIEEMLMNLGTGVLSTLFGAFTFGDLLYQLIDEKVFGGTYYGLELNTLALFNDTKDMVDDIIEGHQKLNDAKTEGAANKYSLQLINAYFDLVKEVCKYFGIPADNIQKTLESVYLYSSEAITGAIPGSTSMPYDVYKTDNYADQAYQAMIDGNTDEFDQLISDIAKYKTGDDPTSSAKKDVKDILQQNYLKGNVTKETAAELLQNYYGMDQEKAAVQLYEWDNDYSTAYEGLHESMDKLVADPDDSDAFSETKKVCQDLIANGKEAKDIANNLKSRYKDDYIAASTSDRVKIKAAVVKILNSVGYSTKKYTSSTFVDSWIE